MKDDSEIWGVRLTAEQARNAERMIENIDAEAGTELSKSDFLRSLIEQALVESGQFTQYLNSAESIRTIKDALGRFHTHFFAAESAFSEFEFALKHATESVLNACWGEASRTMIAIFNLSGRGSDLDDWVDAQRKVQKNKTGPACARLRHKCYALQTEVSLAEKDQACPPHKLARLKRKYERACAFYRREMFK